MSPKKNAKQGKKSGTKQSKSPAPAVGALDVDARAEAVEAIEAQDPEARAEAIETLSDADAAQPENAAAPEPTDTEDPIIAAERLLAEMGFARTGREIEEVRPKILLLAATTWKDAQTTEVRKEAEAVLARAGWFRPPVDPIDVTPDVAPPATDVATPASVDAPSAPENVAAPAAPVPDLAPLQARVEETKAALETTEKNAKAAIDAAKASYKDALQTYKSACASAKVASTIEGRTRGADVSERVSFEVALDGDHVRIVVKGKPETEERIPIEDARKSINKTAYSYTDRRVGPREVVGNKGGSLSNKLRAVLGGGPALAAATESATTATTENA